MVDLGSLGNPSTRAKLIPIIPPSRGHGFDLYKELGTDKLLVYARFDDSTKDFPTDTKFSQISMLKIQHLLVLHLFSNKMIFPL